MLGGRAQAKYFRRAQEKRLWWVGASKNFLWAGPSKTIVVDSRKQNELGGRKRIFVVGVHAKSFGQAQSKLCGGGASKVFWVGERKSFVVGRRKLKFCGEWVQDKMYKAGESNKIVAGA